jgi:RHS repeat-associated protein
VVVLALAASLLSVTALPRPSTAKAEAAARAACPASRPDRVSAVVTARMCGGGVRVDGEESQTTEVVALPDGSLRARTAMAPVRVRQADGSWAPVDLRLTSNADGSVSPRMPAFPVRMSGRAADGEHRLVSVGSGSRAVALEWAGVLPAPVLVGNTATYPQVLPGVDLVVSATTAGVEQNIVVKDRAALARVQGLSLAVTSRAAASFATGAGGGVVLKDATGRVFARVPGMSMWDASPVDRATGEPVKQALPVRVSKLAARAGRSAGVRLGLAPDAAWSTDPGRVFPITVDPTINPELTTFDTYVREDLTSDRSGDSDLQLGVTSGHVARSFLSWDMTALEHAVINSATVYFYDFYSQSCVDSAATQWEVWSTTSGNTDPYTQWSNQPAKIRQESTSQMTTGYDSSCADGWVHADGKGFFQDAANTGKNRGYMELVATDEGPTSIGFKQFRSRQASDPSQVPYAVVNYTATPVIGTRSTTPTSPCVTGSSRPYLASKTPAVKAVVTQADGATSNVNFEWWNTGGSKIGGATATGVASGNTAATTVPSGAFAEGGTYSWRVDAASGTATSAWSSYCEFTIDTTAPAAAPTVSSTDYPSGQWAGTAGTAGTFTFGAAGVADVASYLYGLNSPTPSTPVPASGLGGGAQPSITPQAAGQNVLYVRAVDRAGNKSPITSYTFYVAGAAVTSPTTGAAVAGTTVLSGQAPAMTTGVTYQWRRADTDAWVPIPRSDVTYAAGGATVTSWPVAPAGGVYPNLNWNVKQTLANANTPANLAGRWMLADGSGATAADMTGAHPATLNGGVTWTPDPNHQMTAAFNGSTGYLATAAPVMTTNASYTVSAWVKLTNNTAQHTILSQNGNVRSPFYLQYDNGTNKWRLFISSADVSSPTWYNAASTTIAPQTGVWTHLVGVYDAAARTAKLYLNGQVQGSVSNVTTWNSTGATWIGRSATTWFQGNISDVQIYSRALSATEVTNLYGTGDITNDAVALAGPVQIHAVFTGTGGGTSPVNDFTFDPNNASAATSQVGSGSVNLATGNLTLSDSDVSVDSYGSDLTTARSFNTRQPGVFDTTHMFGPGWTSTATVSDANSPYTNLTVAGSLVQVGTPDGSTIGFTAKTSTTFTPEVGAEDLTLTDTAGVYTLADQDGTMTTFTHVTGAPSGQYAPTAITEPGSNQTTSMTYQTATIDATPVTRPVQLLAPVPSGVTCTTLVKGCRALTFTYATTTTATGTTQAGWGDYAGRLRKVSFTAWDPATSAMTTADLSDYLYDSAGRLVAHWDPRLDNGATHLWTTYSYNSDGTIAAVTPNTQPPWNLAYTTVPGDSGVGRLAVVSRSALTAGTATTTIVYRVPVSGTGAPYDMSATHTSQWDQTEAPTQATAVFDPGQLPTGNQANGTMPTSWTRATITYLDANARTLNTVTPGGNTTTTWYDQYGNETKTLTANNRAEALTATDTAATAQSLETINTYNPDGTQLLTTLGPAHPVTLDNGQTVTGHDLTLNTYDQGAPAGTCPCGLVTTKVTGDRYWDDNGVSHDADLNTTTTTYDWTLRQPLVVTVDPSGLALTTTTAYDPTTGLITTVTTPAGGSLTNTPATTQTIHYQAGTGSGYTECDNHPEWANLPCRTQPGGQPSTGPELPVTVTTYDLYNNPTTVTEQTSAGVLRTTTTSYDQAERVITTSIAGAAGTGNPIPSQRDVYDAATGQLTNVQTLDPNNNITAQTTTAYDTLGRITTYTDTDTDTDNNQSTTNYDLMSRPTIVGDGIQSATVTFDGGGENRGLATQIVDGQAGAMFGTYDADGNLTTENWPNGIVVTHTHNQTGTQTGITYTKPGCGQPDCTLYTQTSTINAAGDIAGYTSSLSTQNYNYDKAGRLTTVHDNLNGQCATRIYGFDNTTPAGKASDRTALTSYDPDTDGTCQTTTPSATTTWTYDTADRINTTGYTYDNLGRTTTIPQADTQITDGGDLTVTYSVNDLVQDIRRGPEGSLTASYVLDVDNQRIRSWTDTTGTTHTNHYSDAGDSPAWTDEGMSSYSRPISGLGGIAAIGSISGIEWQLADLHGDIVETTDGVGIGSQGETDEYGVVRSNSEVEIHRYAWLGTAERSSGNPAGIVVMGARLYNPTLGRFLQTDPIQGASANRYDYCNADGVNCVDPSGLDPSGANTCVCNKRNKYWRYLGYYYQVGRWHHVTLRFTKTWIYRHFNGAASVNWAKRRDIRQIHLSIRCHNNRWEFRYSIYLERELRVNYHVGIWYFAYNTTVDYNLGEIFLGNKYIYA